MSPQLRGQWFTKAAGDPRTNVRDDSAYAILLENPKTPFNVGTAIRAAAGRKCVRCHEDVHASDGEHLCKDLRARLKRQTQAVGVVEAILLRYYVRPVTGDATETVALEIIKAIGGRDNGL